MSSKPSVLTGSDDYRQWLIEIQGIFQCKGLKRHFLGTAAEPALEEGETAHQFARRQREHELHTDQAVGLLKKYVASNLLPHIANISTCKQGLDILAKTLEPSGLARFSTAVSKLLTLQLDPSRSLNDYFVEMDALAAQSFRQLPAIDLPAAVTGATRVAAYNAIDDAFNRMIDKWLLMITLHALPPDYDVVRGVIQDWKETDLNLEKVRSKLRQREAELKQEDSDHLRRADARGIRYRQDRRAPPRDPTRPKSVTWDKLPTDPDRPRLPTDGTNPSSGPFCSYCKRSGHLRAECRKRASDLQRASVATDSASIAQDRSSSRIWGNSHSDDEGESHSSDSDAEDRAFFAHDTGYQPVTGEWLLDSGATSHMAAHHFWFDSYRAITGRTVRLGDNSIISVIGIGSVQATHYINGEPHDVLLHDVLHVPRISVNLISATRLTSAGYIVEIGCSHSRVYDPNSGRSLLQPEHRANSLVIKLYKNSLEEVALTVKDEPLSLHDLHR